MSEPIPRRTRNLLSELPWRRTEGGRPACVWCGTPLTGRRTRWCSNACRDDVEVRSGWPTSIRAALLARDGGVCVRCGMACEEYRRKAEIYHARIIALAKQHEEAAGGWLYVWGDRRKEWRTAGGHYRSPRAQALHSRSLALDRRLRELQWEAHHKHAVVEGGGGCGLDGYETLCASCHKRETSALAGRRARTRKG